MKKLSLLVAASLLALRAEASDSMSFGVVVDNLDVHKNTKLHVREYWKTIVNQSVNWSGEVYDVKASFRREQILVADRSRPLYKGYNIILLTHDVSAAAALKVGERVRFTGTLHDYKAEREGAVLEVADGQLVNAESVVSRDVTPGAAPVRHNRPSSQSSVQAPRPAPTPPAAPARAPSQLPTQGFGTTPAPAPTGPSAGLPTGE